MNFHDLGQDLWPVGVNDVSDVWDDPKQRNASCGKLLTTFNYTAPGNTARESSTNESLSGYRNFGKETKYRSVP